MPKTPIDFSKTIIYGITHVDDSKPFLYVGSTTDLVRRRYKHKHACVCPTSKSHNLKLYRIIRENGGWADFKMCPIEEFPCANKIEAEIREREIADILGGNMNSKRPRLTEEELKNYTMVNNHKRLLHPQTQCDCGGHYLYQNKHQHFSSAKHQRFCQEAAAKDTLYSA